MVGQKLRILFNTEFSMSSSGISKLSREMMKRLHDSGKYFLGEIAGVCKPDDERIDNCPWKVYPTMPGHPREFDEFNAHALNIHGRWKFNETCLEFGPDVVFLTKDAWLEDFAHYFPFRQFYHLIWWNPVDGEPLEPEWIAQAIEADACFTYTDWGRDVLKEAAGTKGNILGTMPLGVDYDVFHPIFDKKGIKNYYGFKDDILVTGFVCRNQPRKLIATMIEAFTNFLLLTTPEIREKSYLFLHTAWPDLSWNIPQLLKDYGIGNKVLLTYQCANCGAVYPTIYSDIGAFCNHCNKPSLATSRSCDGVTDEQMNTLYNFCDTYVQLCTSGGLELPCVEAIAAAIPSMCCDYSGPVDIINKAGAIPIKSMKLIREMESGTNRYMSIPDVDKLAQNLHEIFSLPEPLRRTIGWKQHLKAKDWFNWDKAAQILMDYLDTLPKKDWAKKPFRNHKPTLDIPNNLSVDEMVWFIDNKIKGMPEHYNTYRSIQKSYSLMMGVTGNKPSIKAYNMDMALRDSIDDASFYSFWENKRKEKFMGKITN